MLVSLHSTSLAILDSVFFPATMIGVAYGVTQLSQQTVNSTHTIFKKRTFETAQFYETVVKIRHWKKHLPDGSALFESGFRKKSIREHSTNYYQNFITETYRAELAHTVDVILLSLLWIWNPCWIAVGMTLLGMIGNLPCIFVQRYNRIRFMKILRRSKTN